MTGASDKKQTVTVWLERNDGARFSWAGPVTMTKAQHAAYRADPPSIAVHLSHRPSWPLYPPLKHVRVVSVEIMDRAGRASLSWRAAGSEVGPGPAPTLPA